MKLSRKILDQINEKINKPNYQNLPEKVLQFGTGVLLRGLPDYYINKANNQGFFNGSVAILKSTAKGSIEAYQIQDNLYTICVRGVKHGQTVCENVINGAISRVLSASEDWGKILEIAASNTLEVVISNTTEVGIQLVQDDIFAHPPLSFPGKLLAVLNHRFETFDGDNSKGLVIIPTELIVDNGDKLKQIILVLANRQNLSKNFISWLESANDFCNSLVDRVVPGSPDKEYKVELERELGYDDELLIMSEVYGLWAIQGGERVKRKITFANADEHVVVTPDIEKFRELKLRLLNGTHTLSCGLAYLAGFETVETSLNSVGVEAYMKMLMEKEIGPAIPFDLEEKEVYDFAAGVLDRFRNPQLRHLWLSISINYTSELKLRVLPILLNYEKKFHTTPDMIALGFAAYLKFIQVEKVETDRYYGITNGKIYLINDDRIAYIYNHYQKHHHSVSTILKDISLWGFDLTKVKDFETKVLAFYTAIIQSSMNEVLGKQIFQLKYEKIV